MRSESNLAIPKSTMEPINVENSASIAKQAKKESRKEAKILARTMDNKCNLYTIRLNTGIPQRKFIHISSKENHKKLQYPSTMMPERSEVGRVVDKKTRPQKERI